MQNINRENCAKMHIGMPENEVESFMGCPPGNYATARVEWEEEYEQAMRSWWHVKEWIGDEGMIVVRFGDTTGKVLSVEFRDVFPPQDSFLKKVSSWLKLGRSTTAAK